VKGERLQTVGDRRVGSRQEARADAVGAGPEPEIEGCRLHLVGIERAGDADGAARHQILDRL